MAAIKSYTDLEQSKKLAEILPIESADMGWNVFVDGTSRILPIHDWDLTKEGSNGVKFFHAWSLATLLKLLPKSAQLEKGNVTELYRVVLPVELDASDWYVEPIDACVAMIEKLHELNLL